VKVLVAEDDPETRRVAAKMLAVLGHAAVTVADGEALLRAASLEPPDAVLSDVGLPFCDGIRACSRLRDAFPLVRFVLMTGDPESDARARRAGFRAVLFKPFTLESLRGALAPF
jgi:CheY-like chemotaxis protein